ncbi:MAG TPA: YdeI/OmpD-associated family protein [Cytophagaceae bacterium]|nr:YdeI/OmpD-associated family protein [Cytophagaceae bacterium]
MIRFDAILLQFAEQGEKTGWTYLEVPAALAQKLKPGNKKSFRVKGKLDKFAFDGVSLLPMGEGDFIMAVNAEMRKGIRKIKGANVKVQMELDLHEKPLSAELMECLADEPKALKKFKSLPMSHQKYFSKWVESAKTDVTKAKRITQAVVALATGLGFSEMMKMNKKDK